MSGRPYCWVFSWGLAALAGCGSQGGSPGDGSPSDEAAPATVTQPPFSVRGEAEGLLLVWYDDEGPHTAPRRSAIPEAHRSRVRVDDLSAPPDERLDPAYVYVADLSQPGRDGRYPVERIARDAFDTEVARARGSEVAAQEQAEAPPAIDANHDVVVYGASWCSACRGAARFLRERGIPFVERDIEREPNARKAMLRAARAAGVTPRGIPVIDFRGRVIPGFDRSALERAIRETGDTI